MSFDLTTTTDDDEKKLSDVKSRVRLDEAGSYKGSLRLWMRDGERWYPTLRKTIWILEQLRDFVQVCFSYFCLFLLMNSFLHPKKKACDIPRYRTRSASAMSSIAGDGEREY